MKLIIGLPQEIYDDYMSFDKNEIMENGALIDRAIINGIPIPDNATNGEVMRIMFPKIGLYNEWYDEPYQKCGNSEYLGGELYEVSLRTDRKVIRNDLDIL